MKKIAVFLAVAVLSFMIFVSSPTPSQAQKSRIHRKPNKIENQYIVVLDDAVVGEKGDYSIAPYVASEMAANYKGKSNTSTSTPSMASLLRRQRLRQKL